MTDSLRLYRTILVFVCEHGLRFHDLRCLANCVWAMVAVIQSHTVSLSRWSIHRVGTTAAASKVRQWRRWLENALIQPAVVYQVFIRRVLQAWAGTTVYLALDSSSLWGRYTTVRVALIFRGRALPLAWQVLPSASAMVEFATYNPLLVQTAVVLPRPSRVVLLADRGFADVRLLRLAHDLGWHFRVRLRGSLRVHRGDFNWSRVSRWLPPPGQALFVQQVWLTAQQLGPVHLALAQVQTAQGYERWAIVSDEPTDLTTFDEYGLRFDTEELFLDDKSAGFQLEASELRDAAALERLGLILALTTVYLVNTGVAVVALERRWQVDTHWQRALSYFQIGWRFVQHALSHGARLVANLWLEPGPDPQPCWASKRQAAQPIAILSAIHADP